MTVYPVTLQLPNGSRRQGAIRANGWDAAVVFALQQYPGAIIQPSSQLTIPASSPPAKVAPVAPAARA
jgi:hypothetical protein